MEAWTVYSPRLIAKETLKFVCESIREEERESERRSAVYLYIDCIYLYIDCIYLHCNRLYTWLYIHSTNMTSNYRLTFILIYSMFTTSLYLQFHFNPAGSSLFLWISDSAPLSSASCFKEVIHRLIQPGNTHIQGTLTFRAKVSFSWSDLGLTLICCTCRKLFSDLLHHLHWNIRSKLKQILWR